MMKVELQNSENGLDHLLRKTGLGTAGADKSYRN
jgi:hypothetical protein